MNVLIGNNIASVRKRIFDACCRSNRDPSEVHLLAVSKTKSIRDIITAQEAGLGDFAENYLQEAVEKVDTLRDYSLTWHFIGRIQSNKTKLLAEKFDWIHTLSSSRAGKRLHEQRPISLGPINVLVQVNISQDPDKGGVLPDNLFELLENLMGFERLNLRGLMTIPQQSQTFDEQRIPFAKLRNLLEQTKARYSSDLKAFDQLSMGMSRDLEAAIAEGATWVRVGTDLFGPRE